jgi:hypothetical protein
MSGDDLAPILARLARLEERVTTLERSVATSTSALPMLVREIVTSALHEALPSMLAQRDERQEDLRAAENWRALEETARRFARAIILAFAGALGASLFVLVQRWLS